MNFKNYQQIVQDMDEIKTQIYEHIDEYISCRAKRFFISKCSYSAQRWNMLSFESNLATKLKEYEEILHNSFNQCDNWQFEWNTISMTGLETWSYGGREEHDFSIDDVKFFFDTKFRKTCINDVNKEWKEISTKWLLKQKGEQAVKKAEEDAAELKKYQDLKKKFGKED